MDLLQLHYFQAVARRDHFSRAAEELHVAQPSLSRAVARLERELGLPLFDRLGRRVRLNEQGAVLLRHVDRALAELEDARAELATGAERPTLAIAAETLLSLTALLGDFLAAHPSVRVRLRESSPPEMIAQLRSAEIDLCLASQPLADRDVDTVTLRREEVLVATKPGDPLAASGRVAIAALDGRPLVITRHGHWLRELADRLFAAAGIQPELVCETDEPAALRPLIAAGLGFGLLPAGAREGSDHPAVGWAALDAPGAHRTLALAWRRDAHLTAAAVQFRDLAIERLQSPRAETLSDNVGH